MTPRRCRLRGDRGSAALEYLGVLPILLLVALAGIQLGLAAYVASQAGTSARAAARAEAKYESDVSGKAAGLEAVSTWLQGNTNVEVDEGDDSVLATTTIAIPSVIPGLDLPEPVTRTATMPREDVSTP